jgi:hypothetical protein
MKATFFFEWKILLFTLLLETVYKSVYFGLLLNGELQFFVLPNYDGILRRERFHHRKVFCSEVPFVGEKICLHGNSETFNSTKCIPSGLKPEVTTQMVRYFDIFSLKSIWIQIQSSK